MKISPTKPHFGDQCSCSLIIRFTVPTATVFPDALKDTLPRDLHLEYSPTQTGRCKTTSKTASSFATTQRGDFFATLRRRSTTGYLFIMKNGPISWRSILQDTVALSTTEVEYMTLTEGIKEALWSSGLINELGIYQKKVEVHCDSQSVIHLAKYQIYHSRTKHIDVRFHYVRDIVKQKKIMLKKVGTADNPADMLTKVVGAAKFEHCLDLVHILHA